MNYKYFSFLAKEAYRKYGLAQSDESHTTYTPLEIGTKPVRIWIGTSAMIFGPFCYIP